MTTEWIPTITNRNINDVTNARYDPENNPKGTYNYTDLNRIENDTQYCLEYMQEQEVITEPVALRIKTDWTADEKVTYEEIKRIIGNIQLLGSYTDETIQAALPTLQPTDQMNYVLANKIEEYLNILHILSPTPSDYYYFSVEHGNISTIETITGEVILVNNSNANLGKDEIATIQAMPYGPYADDQLFLGWQTDPIEDIAYVNDPTSMTTTYIGQGHTVKLIAKFHVHLLRTLTLTNAYISVDGDSHAESGPRTGVYYPDEEVMIIADRAPDGKRFDKWDGTPEFIRTLTTAELHSSTLIITTTEEDVNLIATYVNAGPHTVTVYEENLVTSNTWYEYEDYFTIIAPDKGEKYTFANWGGDTYYIDDIHAPIISGVMPDINLVFRANYNYNYSFNTVTMTQGTIEGESILNSAREATPYQIQCSPPSGYGFDYWSVEGEGYFIDSEINPTTFIVGDGNATITPHYTPLRILSIGNTNNVGRVTTRYESAGKEVTVSTSEIAGGFIFSHWEKDGYVASQSSIYKFNMPDADCSLLAVYRVRTSINITINHGNHTSTITMLERDFQVALADQPATGYKFSHWSGDNIYTIDDKYNNFTSFEAGSTDGTLLANFVEIPGPIEHYDVIVTNGSGSGTYENGARIPIAANTAPLAHEFSHWELVSGQGTILNTYSSITKFDINGTNAIITAKYKPLPVYDVIVNNGYVESHTDVWVEQGRFLRNSAPKIKAKPAPRGHKFKGWKVLEGDRYDIVQSLAETTTLRNVTHNITIEAEYYRPDPITRYTLTIHNKNNTTNVSSHIAGAEVPIQAQPPNEGDVFYRWDGDYNYLMEDRSVANNTVRMPDENIELWMTYISATQPTKYNLHLYNALCLIDTQPSGTTPTEIWTSNAELEEGEVVRIKPMNIASGWKFDGWIGETDAQVALIKNVNEENTYITMSNFECNITATTIPENKYTLNVIGGATSGQYGVDNIVPVYFTETPSVYDDMLYEFDRWTGDDVSEIELYDGSPFDIYEAGSEKEPQYIKMPKKKLTIYAEYTPKYHVVLENGTINDTEETYFAQDTILNITADTPAPGYVFQRWVGDTDYLVSKWDPTTTLTVPNEAIILTAKYSNVADRNSVGYGTISFFDSNVIDKTDITIISGELGNGFMLSDNKGHIYVVTEVATNTVTVTRLTRKQEGGNVYE